MGAACGASKKAKYEDPKPEDPKSADQLRAPGEAAPDLVEKKQKCLAEIGHHHRLIVSNWVGEPVPLLGSNYAAARKAFEEGYGVYPSRAPPGADAIAALALQDDCKAKDECYCEQ